MQRYIDISHTSKTASTKMATPVTPCLFLPPNHEAAAVLHTLGFVLYLTKVAEIVLRHELAHVKGGEENKAHDALT